MNKYNKNTIIINGEHVDKTKRVFIPKEKQDGTFTTRDGKMYQRQKDGSIRRINTFA